MPLIQKLQALIKDRKWQEADKVADELLSLMSSGEKNETTPCGSFTKGEMTMRKLAVVGSVACYRRHRVGSGSGESNEEGADSRRVEGGDRSPEAAKVAWREIAWKSCLLEGLKESRAKNKPALLWVFIDRPIDDARC